MFQETLFFSFNFRSLFYYILNYHYLKMWWDYLGQAHKRSHSVLWLPPTTFLFLWLRNKIRFTAVTSTHKNHDFGSKMNTKYLIWKDCRQQYQMSWVHQHLLSVLQHCVCLLLLLSPYGCIVRFITLLWQAHEQHQHDFGSEIMNNKKSHLIRFQRTTTDGLGAQTST